MLNCIKANFGTKKKPVLTNKSYLVSVPNIHEFYNKQDGQKYILNTNKPESTKNVMTRA